MVCQWSRFFFFVIFSVLWVKLLKISRFFCKFFFNFCCTNKNVLDWSCNFHHQPSKDNRDNNNQKNGGKTHSTKKLSFNISLFYFVCFCFCFLYPQRKFFYFIMDFVVCNDDNDNSNCNRTNIKNFKLFYKIKKTELNRKKVPASKMEKREEKMWREINSRKTSHNMTLNYPKWSSLKQDPQSTFVYKVRRTTQGKRIEKTASR